MRRLDDVLRNFRPNGGNGAHENGDAPAPTFQAPAAEDDGSTCPVCKGARFLRRDLPLDDPEFGKVVPCRCVASESEETRLARLHRYSNLGPLTRLTFSNLSKLGLSTDPRDRTRFQRCVQDAEEFAKDPHGWLVLIGASGCGKTHIAAAIANRCLENGTPALFVIVPDLLDHLRAAYRPSAEVDYDQLFEQVRNAPVLILDDLGTESSTPWAQEKLFQIVNHRYNARLATVITTNVSLQKTDERLRTRFTDVSLTRVYEIGQRSVLEHRNVNSLFQTRIRAMTFENFDISGHGLPARQRESLEAAYRGCRTYAEHVDGWVLLSGGPGCGKTHLAAAIANARVLQGERPMFVKASRLLQLYRSTFDDQTELRLAEVEQEVENSPLLILDDLFFRPSRGWKSDWANEQLFSLVDYRYENRLPTVYTTAMTEAAMSSDEVGHRFAARLWDSSVTLELPIMAPAYKLPGRLRPAASGARRAKEPED